MRPVQRHTAGGYYQGGGFQATYLQRHQVNLTAALPPAFTVPTVH
jgi:hypothetical protein